MRYVASLFFILMFSISSTADTIHVPDEQPTIQAGIDAAATGDTVLVADGHYTGDGNRDIDFKGKAITVRSESGSDYTTINCQYLGRGFYFHQNEDADSYLDGFTIINGAGNDGGGILCLEASPTIRKCSLLYCDAGDEGGGIYCDDSSPSILGCLISFSHGYLAGGIYLTGSSPTIEDCVISDNSSSYKCGGIMCEGNSAPRLLNCVISGNEARLNGGVYCYGSSPDFTDCIIMENRAIDFGYGGIYFRDCNSTLTNCQIIDDSVDLMVDACNT